MLNCVYNTFCGREDVAASQKPWVSHHDRASVRLISQSHLIEESNDLARDMLSPCLLMVHNARAGGQNDVAKLTRRQQLDNPLLEVAESDVVAGRDDTSLVKTAVQLNNDLPISVVINFLKFADVAFCKQSVILFLAGV